jgi:hypothetical protein
MRVAECGGAAFGTPREDPVNEIRHVSILSVRGFGLVFRCSDMAAGKGSRTAVDYVVGYV